MPTYRLSVRIDYPGASGGPGYNVWHMRASGGFEGGDAANDNLHDFYSAIAGLYPSGTTIVGPLEAVDIVDKSVSIPDTLWEVDGTGSGSFAPLATAITATWYTTVATRSGRGRTFLGPVMADAVDGDGQPTGDVLALLRGAVDDFVAANNDPIEAAFGVWSEHDSVIRDIVRGAVHDRFASLRSRRD